MTSACKAALSSEGVLKDCHVLLWLDDLEVDSKKETLALETTTPQHAW